MSWVPFARDNANCHTCRKTFVQLSHCSRNRHKTWTLLPFPVDYLTQLPRLHSSRRFTRDSRAKTTCDFDGKGRGLHKQATFKLQQSAQHNKPKTQTTYHFTQNFLFSFVKTALQVLQLVPKLLSLSAALLYSVVSLVTFASWPSSNLVTDVCMTHFPVEGSITALCFVVVCHVDCCLCLGSQVAHKSLTPSLLFAPPLVNCQYAKIERHRCLENYPAAGKSAERENKERKSVTYHWIQNLAMTA